VSPTVEAQPTHVGEDFVWAQILRTPERYSKPTPALFLDRDGVIIDDVGYLHDPDGVQLITGASLVIAKANRLGYAVVVVTNQGGIGLGYFGWPEFGAVQDRIYEELKDGDDAVIDAVYASPYHPRGNGVLAHPGHPSRKPNPGMLFAAAERLNLDLKQSWIVGDHFRDLEAGRNAGIAGGMHVMTGHGGHEGQREGARAQAINGFQVVEAGSIAEAPELIPMFG
jgi:D-glycero-D-manno-heptose 1,7-bisphosphate phosphatase